MKTIVHVNQHAIRRNATKGTVEPVPTIKTYKSNDYAHEVIIRHEVTGEEIARIVYRPDKPLSCGARVWIETQHSVEAVTEGTEEEGARNGVGKN